MKCTLIRDMDGETGKPLPAGTVIDHRDAFRLVQMGVAIPLDEDCRRKCLALGLTQEEIADARKAYERTNLGIHPDDFEAYEAGWMAGYLRTNKNPKVDALGNTSNVWNPGQKWDEYQALLAQRQDELLAEDDDDEEEPDCPAEE